MAWRSHASYFFLVVSDCFLGFEDVTSLRYVAINMNWNLK